MTQCAHTHTFILGWVNTLLKVPVLTAAGHLDDVELTHASFTLGAKRRQKVKFEQ